MSPAVRAMMVSFSKGVCTVWASMAAAPVVGAYYTGDDCDL